eukprot:1853535-Alexandrium_andersonii.AAC.1
MASGAFERNRLNIWVRQYCVGDASSGPIELAIRQENLEALLKTFTGQDEAIVRRKIRTTAREHHTQDLVLPSGLFKCVIIPVLCCKLGNVVSSGDWENCTRCCMDSVLAAEPAQPALPPPPTPSHDNDEATHLVLARSHTGSE